MSSEKINCDDCGKSGARTIHVSRSYGKGTGLLVIEMIHQCKKIVDAIRGSVGPAFRIFGTAKLH